MRVGSVGSSDKNLFFERHNGLCPLIVFQIGWVDMSEGVKGLNLTWDGKEGVDSEFASGGHRRRGGGQGCADGEEEGGGGVGGAIYHLAAIL